MDGHEQMCLLFDFDIQIPINPLATFALKSNKYIKLFDWNGSNRRFRADLADNTWALSMKIVVDEYQ